MVANDGRTELMSYDEAQSPSQYYNKGNLTKSLGSSTSSRSGGPTPKRTRTENPRAFKPSLTGPRKVSHAKPARRATSGFSVKGQRQALRNLGSASQNEVLLTPTQPLTQKSARRHTSAAVVETNENERAMEEAEFGDMAFNDSDVFTSTDQQRLATFHDHVARHDYDETTADV